MLGTSGSASLAVPAAATPTLGISAVGEGSMLGGNSGRLARAEASAGGYPGFEAEFVIGETAVAVSDEAWDPEPLDSAVATAPGQTTPHHRG